MRKPLSLGLGLTAAALTATVMTPTAGWAAVSYASAQSLATSSTPAAANAPAAIDPPTTVTATVATTGTIGITVAPTGDLGTGDPGTGTNVLTATFGATTVTDTRDSDVGWTATASSTDFVSTAPIHTIPVAANATYSADSVGGFTTIVTAPATATPVSAGAVGLSATAVPVVTTADTGNNTVSWTPTETLTLPPGALVGAYTSTLSTSLL